MSENEKKTFVSTLRKTGQTALAQALQVGKVALESTASALARWAESLEALRGKLRKAPPEPPETQPVLAAS